MEANSPVKINSLIAVSVLCLTQMAGQDLTIQPMPLPRPQEQYDAVRQFLVLTPAQLSALMALQTSKRNAEAEIYRQMHQKQTELDALLQAGSNDAVSIGRLMVDINNLRKELPDAGAPFRNQALAVLEEPQKARLAQLTQALELQPTANEAVQLNLVEYPRIPSTLILPAAQEPASVNVVSEL
jgi:hypothetical protein